MGNKNEKYDIKGIKKALQDEYMAASLVGFTDNTPDIMDIEFSNSKELLSMAERSGLNLEEFLVSDEEQA